MNKLVIPKTELILMELNVANVFPCLVSVFPYTKSILFLFWLFLFLRLIPQYSLNSSLNDLDFNVFCKKKKNVLTVFIFLAQHRHFNTAERKKDNCLKSLNAQLKHYPVYAAKATQQQESGSGVRKNCRFRKTQLQRTNVVFFFFLGSQQAYHRPHLESRSQHHLHRIS